MRMGFSLIGALEARFPLCVMPNLFQGRAAPGFVAPHSGSKWTLKQVQGDEVSEGRLGIVKNWET
jgi:hypothetical protein